MRSLRYASARTVPFLNCLVRKMFHLSVVLILIEIVLTLLHLEAEGFQKSSCGAPVRHNYQQTAINYVLFTVSLGFVSVRIASRSPWINGKWILWWDDWIAISCIVRVLFPGVDQLTVCNAVPD